MQIIALEIKEAIALKRKHKKKEPRPATILERVDQAVEREEGASTLRSELEAISRDLAKFLNRYAPVDWPFVVVAMRDMAQSVERDLPPDFQELVKEIPLIVGTPKLTMNKNPWAIEE